MDRLTTGRRHVRAGSVTVTELLVKQASPARCTDSSPAEPDDITDTIPVVGPVSHRRPPARVAHVAKLASIGLAGAVLCGAVVVSSMIAHQRRENAQSAATPTLQITGDQALLPDRMDRRPQRAPVPTPPPGLPPASAAPTAPSPPLTAAPVPAAEQVGGPVSGNTATGPAAGQPTGPVTGPATDLELVREFYENLPAAPTAAFELLSPGLLHSTLGEFLQSWSTVVAIDSLDVVQHVGGVLATVRMRLLGGGHLRVQQLVTVAESPRRIVGVQLLSAQRN